MPSPSWLKTGYQGQVNQAFLYYTIDGATYPEGAGGIAANPATNVVPLIYQQHGANDGSNVTDWWKGTLPALGSGTVLRYKIGLLCDHRRQRLPEQRRCRRAQEENETRFQVTNFNAATAIYHPHDDYAPTLTGLTEGFHVLRTRQFLNRQAAPRSTTPAFKPLLRHAAARRRGPLSRQR